MVKVDLNWISVVGLVLGVAAAALMVREMTADSPWTVGALLGPEAPGANLSIWMVLAVAGAAVYLVGRIVFLARNQIGAPPPVRRRPRDGGEDE